ncbi:hypothetical protein [Bowmanella sp. JS7-9]|uniref:Uncharacterized protein n=1 Tax=Pseudobowmanella zhangzhouensis TaxID=1537679 RepID=A0ABW1XMQ8_9ALTE|nr:hypothetical protein [Bowmanella sp. JS7-9]TBX27408.1 hypothetical protein TK45_01290 [Bowmanella sp. JS7-9]
MEFADHPIALLIVIICNWPVYKTLAKLFFGEQYQDFAECLKYVAQANWYSALRGKYWEDFWATFKFNTFIICCIGWTLAITEVVARVFLN